MRMHGMVEMRSQQRAVREGGPAHAGSHIAKGENIGSTSFQPKDTCSQLCSR